MTRLQAKDRVISFGSKINSTWSYCSVRFLETVRSSFQAKASSRSSSPASGERRLRPHKLPMHQPARRIVDVNEQRALGPARLEPPMPRAVHLDQFANTIPTVARLMHGPHPLPAVLPYPRRHHPLPHLP